jgi:L-seryl-tRNA(Ser) seleniumtransferase
MISAPVKVIDNRARRLLRRLKKNLAEQAIFSVSDSSSRVGGGAMPEQHLASRAIRVKPFSLPVSQLERRLRDQ